MTIYHDVMEELNRRETYLREDYAPFFIASWAQHQFNLMNRRRQIYWVNGVLPNARLHILFVSPSGFMKTHYLKTMAGDDYGMFKGCGSVIGFEQEMTAPGFTGTSYTNNGNRVDYDGAAKDYENGFMLIDEFKGLTEALQGQGNGQFETQLLSALDSGRVVKRLAATRNEFITNFTMWTGIQPSCFSTSNSGLARRLTYLLCLPTSKDNEVLRNLRFKHRGSRPDTRNMQLLWSKQKTFIAELDNIREVVFHPEVEERYRKMGHFHFEAEYYDSLLLGITLAVKGVSPTIEVDLKIPEVVRILERETEWRKQINRNPVHAAVLIMLKELKSEASLEDILSVMDMYSMKTEEVIEALNALRQNGKVIMKNGKYFVK